MLEAKWWYESLDVGQGDYSPLSSGLIWCELFLIVFVNFSYWPACVIAFSRRQMYEGVMILFAFFCSIMYHAGDLVHARLLGMVPVQWHLVDNIFQITAVNAMTFHLFLANNRSPSAELYRWVMLGITVICQQLSPWHPLTTLFPILLPLFVCGFNYMTTTESARPRYNHKLMWGVLMLLLAGLTFMLAFPMDVPEVVRLLHGASQLCLGVSFALLLAARNEDKRSIGGKELDA